VNAPVIKLENVYKHYPLYHHMAGGLKRALFHLTDTVKTMRKTKYLALQDISFEVSAGESLGIIGRNGAGKSTILALIAGVLHPTSGNVFVHGRVCPLLELGGGFHPDLNGRENILLNGVLMGMSRREVLSRMEQIVEFSELGEFIDQPIRTYSSGMMARLGFSVVAHLDPKILLIDEIFAVGDKEFQEKCKEKIKEFKRNSVTIIFVSHSMGDIQEICDRVIWLDGARIVSEGNTEQVVEMYIAS
jgi:lipopolysaccharide transport system ATP-binding protein